MLHLFADDEHVASTVCGLPAPPEQTDVPADSWFQLTVPLPLLQPAERVVRAVGVHEMREAGFLPADARGSRESSLFAGLPIAGPGQFATAAQLPLTRTNDPMLLVYLARWGLATFEPGTGAFASAICVLGYRVLEKPDRLRRLTAEVWHAVNQWNARVLVPRNRAIARWHISLNTVAGYLGLLEGDLDRAASQFEGVAAAYGEIARSPISAHNVSICTFLAGWLRYKRGDRDVAADYFRQTITVIRVGLQVQPIDTNYPVWNECGRMSYLGQQALWMLGHLDPDFGERAFVPLDPERFTLAPVLVRVPQLLDKLPAELKTV